MISWAFTSFSISLSRMANICSSSPKELILLWVCFSIDESISLSTVANIFSALASSFTSLATLATRPVLGTRASDGPPAGPPVDGPWAVGADMVAAKDFLKSSSLVVALSTVPENMFPADEVKVCNCSLNTCWARAASSVLPVIPWSIIFMAANCKFPLAITVPNTSPVMEPMNIMASVTARMALVKPRPPEPLPPISTSTNLIISPMTTLAAVAATRWKSAIWLVMLGPVETPNSSANDTKASKLSMAPDWMNLGPAFLPNISAAKAAFSSWLVTCWREWKTSFKTSSAVRNCSKPSTVWVVATPNFWNASWAFFEPLAAWFIIWGSRIKPISSSSKANPLPSAANLSPFSVSTFTPVLALASTS